MEIPQLLGDYEIGQKIGAGSMGTVYLARRRALDKDVAVKVLHPQWALDPEVTERFATEARSAASIDHVNVVRVLDYGQQGGLLFLAMEFIEGLNLKEVLRLEGALPVPLAVVILRDLCRGLEAAHEKGVIHRDIKPENLAITCRGVVKIMDFGLARRVHDSGVTIQGTVLGTAAYMSPEQARGDLVDHRTDIFSLGLVGYEILSGRRAYPGTNTHDVIGKVLTEDPTPLSTLLPAADPEIVSVIEAMTRRDRDARCHDISEALDSLERIARRLDLPREDRLLRDLVERVRGVSDNGTILLRPAPADRTGPTSTPGPTRSAEPAPPLQSMRTASPTGTGEPALPPVEMPIVQPQQVAKEEAERTHRRWKSLPAIGGALVLLLAAFVVKQLYDRPDAEHPPHPAPSPQLAAVAVDPPTVRMRPGMSQEFRATGTFENDSIAVLASDEIQWRSESLSVATIDVEGNAVALAPGDTRILATARGLTGEASLTVETARELSRMYLDPQSTHAAVGDRVQFRVWGVYSDQMKEDLTTRVEWSVTPPGGMEFLEAGRFRLTAAGGPYRVTATFAEREAVGTVTVRSSGPWSGRFDIILRGHRAEYVLVDGIRHDATSGSILGIRMTEGAHTLTVVDGDREWAFRYTVVRDDPHDGLKLNLENGSLEPTIRGRR